MPIVTTTAVWDPLVSPADDALIKAKAQQMFEAGLTASVSAATSPIFGGIANNVAPMTSVRTWNTQEAAQEWVEFITAYNPQSITINS